jgi:hypothetical protein
LQFDLSTPTQSTRVGRIIDLSKSDKSDFDGNESEYAALHVEAKGAAVLYYRPVIVFREDSDLGREQLVDILVHEMIDERLR